MHNIILDAESIREIGNDGDTVIEQNGEIYNLSADLEYEEVAEALAYAAYCFGEFLDEDASYQAVYKETHN